MSTAQEILNYIVEAGAALEADFQLYTTPDSWRLSLMTYEEMEDEDGHGGKTFELDDALFKRLHNAVQEKNEAEGNDPGAAGQVLDLVEWLTPLIRSERLNALLS